jgi:hypothetical protein
MNKHQLLNVYQYINKIEYLRKFALVSKKCNCVVKTFGMNTFPLNKLEIKDCELLKKDLTIRCDLSDVFDLDKFKIFEKPNINLITTFDQYVMLSTLKFQSEYFKPSNVKTLIFNFNSNSQELRFKYSKAYGNDESNLNRILAAYSYYDSVNREEPILFNELVKFLILSTDSEIYETLSGGIKCNTIFRDKILIKLFDMIKSNEYDLSIDSLVKTKLSNIKKIILVIDFKIEIDKGINKTIIKTINKGILEGLYTVYTVKENETLFKKKVLINDVLKYNYNIINGSEIDYSTSNELYLCVNRMETKSVKLPISIFGDYILTDLADNKVYDFRPIKFKLDDDEEQIGCNLVINLN